MKNFKYTAQQPFFATINGVDIALGKDDEKQLDETNRHIANLVATGVLVETVPKIQAAAKANS